MKKSRAIMAENTKNEPLNNFLSNATDTTSEDKSCTIVQNENHCLNEDDKRMRELRNKDKETDIDLKKIYGTHILAILIGWLGMVALIILGQLGPCYYKLSDNVLITLITTTTANVLILPTIVLKYLFPQNKESDE